MRTLSLLSVLKRAKTPAVPRPRRGWGRFAFRAVVGSLLLLITAEVLRILIADNTHTVVPGRVYRSAQLSADDLRDLIQQHGIRTVVNLRGYCPWFDWYQDESRLVHELNLSQEDVTLSANRMPSPSEIRRLIEVLDFAEYPLVMHCRQGADRTGLASAIYMLLYTDADYDQARRQCSPRYGHFPILSTISMDRFFHQYEEWLRQHGFTHAPPHFRRWVLEDYRAAAPARLELLGPEPEVAVGQATTTRVRARNLSNVVWEFKPGTNAGIHLRYSVSIPGSEVLFSNIAGRFEARVAPGETIDIDLPLPPFMEVGEYQVIANLSDKQLAFSQLGSDFLEFTVRVRDAKER